MSLCISPCESAFFQCINVGDSQGGDKSADAPECEWGILNEFAKLNGPWVKENYFNVKNDKKHGKHIEFNAEPWGAFALRKHATFVGRFFGWVATSFFSKQYAHSEHDATKSKGDNGLHNNGNVIFEHECSW